MPRFLHTADWQIGRRYNRFSPDDGAHLAEQRVATIATIARLATERQVDAVLVAGDVFDAQTVSDRVIRQLFQALAGFTGPWVLIAGNHDAALGESVWTRAQRLGAVPPQAILALTPGVIALEACRTAILPAPLTQRHTYDDMTAWFDGAETPDGWLRLGLAHGSLDGVLADDIDSANPISAGRVASARLDYLALGDWHGLKMIGARCAYSGTPEPERFRDNEPGSCLVVEIDGPGALPRLEAVRVGRYRWSSLVETLRVASDVDQLATRLAGLGDDDVVELTLDGQIDLAGQRRLEETLGQAEAKVRSLEVDRSELRLQPTQADIDALQADGYLAEVIEELRQALGDDEQTDAASVAREALAILCGVLDRTAPADPGPAT